jgi:predicted flap endonuclease-1-like 5' DNA nuclease
MLWLIWQMWFLLALALGIGVVIGWRIWGASPDADGRSLAAARDEVERLRRENDDLHRSLAMARRDREDSVVEPVSVREAPKAAEPVVEPVLGEDEDDLQAIKGLGPKAAKALKAGGVVRYAQIAAWTEDDIAQWDTDLGARGRIVRDDWVGQAKTLSVR